MKEGGGGGGEPAMLNEIDPQKRKAHHDELKRNVADDNKHKAYVLRSSMIKPLQDLENVDWWKFHIMTSVPKYIEIAEYSSRGNPRRPIPCWN